MVPPITSGTTNGAAGVSPLAPEVDAALAATEEQSTHPAPPTEGVPLTNPPVNPAQIPQVLAPTDGAEAATDEEVPGPDTEMPAEYARFYQLMTKLFGGNIFSERLLLWVEAQIKANGKICISDDSFREMLAEELKIPESMISDAGLDYFFGNQDGELNGSDTMSLSRLIDRLEFLVPIYQGQAQVGGSTATQTLRADTIMLMSFESDCLDDIDFVALRKSGDPLFTLCMEAAVQSYMNSADATEDGKKAVVAYYNGQGDLPDELQELLFSNYWAAFKSELGRRASANGTQAMPIDLLNENEELRQQFLNGIFLDFVEGSLAVGDAPENEEAPPILVHQIPEEIDEESITAAYNDRLNRLPEQSPVEDTSQTAAAEPAAEAAGTAPTETPPEEPAQS